MVTAGESNAKLMNSRPFTGRFTIWRSVITVLTSVRVGSTSSEAAATSTFSSTPPGVNVKSNSADCPTCKTTFLLCFRNPANSTETAYSPAGKAGMKYSPFSEVCAALVNPVAALAMVTFALETLPPDVSKILPDSVAVMACPFVIGAETPISANKHARQTARHTKDGFTCLMTLTPKNVRNSRMPWSISERASGRRCNLMQFLPIAGGPTPPGAAALHRGNKGTPLRS